MKYLFFLLVVCSATQARVKYLSNASGVLLASISQKEKIQFNPGELVSCEKKGSSELILYICTLKGAQLAIEHTNGEAVVHTFGQVSILERPTKKFRDYFFSGHFTETVFKTNLESTTELSLRQWEDNLNRIIGNFQLKELGLSATVQLAEDH